MGETGEALCNAISLPAVPSALGLRWGLKMSPLPLGGFIPEGTCLSGSPEHWDGGNTRRIHPGRLLSAWDSGHCLVLVLTAVRKRKRLCECRLAGRDTPDTLPP